MVCITSIKSYILPKLMHFVPKPQIFDGLLFFVNGIGFW